MILALLFTMLLSSVFSYFFNWYFGKKGTFFISIFNMGLCFLYSLYLFLDMISASKVKTTYISLGSWIDVLYFDVTWDILLDDLSISMLFIVVSISFLVHIYSYYYMYDDIYSSKFMSFLSLFTFFMCILVVSSNFIMLFLGWEGVGICSFLLISFWSTRVQANKAALKAMLVNRVGDFCLLVAIVYIIIVFKTVDFNAVFSLAHIYSLKPFIVNKYISISVLDFICFFLLIGAITKSAQFGMHTWLPDAMEGPTPVSALIHAATMVTAGVFLIIRCSFMFEFSPFALTILVYLGSLTLLLFGFVGIAQFDIKKIIAYSTCSQLGYMMLACGLSAYNLALFHLFTHAWFKALLFLSAGSIIHTMRNEQDIRKLGGFFNKSPLVSICFIIGSFSLIGIPHMSGYYSKDAIICLSRTYDYNIIIYVSTVIGVATTTFYSLRMFYYLFCKKIVTKRSVIPEYNYKTNYANVVPLVILTLMSIFAGYLAKVFFIGLGNNTFYGSILILDFTNIIFSEFLFDHLRYRVIIPAIILTAAWSYGFLNQRYIDREDLNEFYYYFFGRDFFTFFNKRMFFDSLVNTFVVGFFFEISYKLFYIVDKGFFEFIGPVGLFKTYNKIWMIFSKGIYRGSIWEYLHLILVIVIFSVLILFVLL
jgi:proton-translocating NADH-quinone oxidoreductase chain L